MRKLDKRLADIRNKLLIKMWNRKKAELTLKDIGRIFGLNISTTWAIIKKHNTKL